MHFEIRYNNFENQMSSYRTLSHESWNDIKIEINFAKTVNIFCENRTIMILQTDEKEF